MGGLFVICVVLISSLDLTVLFDVLGTEYVQYRPVS